MNEPNASITPQPDSDEVLVVIFLRGGADGLSLVPPIEDDDYYRARPRLSIRKKDAVRLDGMFGLHPLLQPLKEIYYEESLLVIPAAGCEDSSRSHFEAQDFVEHGGIAGGGWLGRWLRSRPRENRSALGAVTLGNATCEALRGAPSATALRSLQDYSLGNASSGFLANLERLYNGASPELAAAGSSTLKTVARIELLQKETYNPDPSANYGTDSFSIALRQAAQLIKSNVGLEALCLDHGGWDSHFTQDTLIEPLLRELGAGLLAFYRDLGPRMQSTTVVVMTEFGRRVEENSSFGTDHGRGGTMFVLGGRTRGGRVLGSWPGLAPTFLEGPGDVPVVHNYRNVLAPILSGMNQAPLSPSVFPNFDLNPALV